MTQQCVNCPGAEDHSTAQCPVMAEASAVVNQQVTAADSLPVGVPDGYMPIPTAEQMADALDGVRCYHDMSAELIAPRLLANLLAATTVKAEQVQCEVCHGQGEVYSGHDQHFHYFDFQPPEPIMEVCPECGGEEAPSLPAAGSADLTAVRCQCCATEYPHDSYDAGFIAGSGMCQVCDAAIPAVDLPSAAPAEQPYPHGIAEDLERSDWAPLEALQWYAAGKHFDVADGRTRIIDTGAVASNALKHASLAYLELKGDAELSELRAALSSHAAGSAELIADAERCLFVMREIGSMDGDDITGDDVDLRFEDDGGHDTGCDVSIVEYAEKSADVIEKMIAALSSHAAGSAAAVLLPALRQYRHNCGGDELIPGYDYEETNRIVAALSAQQSAQQSASPEFCCELSYKAAKQKAWDARLIERCKCDHNEYCDHCWPADFRPGGKWHGKFVAQQSAHVSVPECKLGIRGRAYDAPSVCRAYTYTEQPNNDHAWKLGKAASAVKAGGDYIDAGLSLLEQLQANGFGVFELRALLNGGEA